MFPKILYFFNFHDKIVVFLFIFKFLNFFLEFEEWDLKECIITNRITYMNILICFY